MITKNLFLLSLLTIMAFSVDAANYKELMTQGNQFRKQNKLTEALKSFEAAAKTTDKTREIERAILDQVNCLHRLRKRPAAADVLKEIYTNKKFSSKQRRNAIRRALNYIPNRAEKEKLAKTLEAMPDATAQDHVAAVNVEIKSLVEARKYQQALNAYNKKLNIKDINTQSRIDAYKGIGQLQRDQLKNPQASLNAFNAALTLYQEILINPKTRKATKERIMVKRLEFLSRIPEFYQKFLQDARQAAQNESLKTETRVKTWELVSRVAFKNNDEATGFNALEQALILSEDPNAQARLYMLLAGASYKKFKPINQTRAYVKKAMAINNLSPYYKRKVEIATRRYADND